MTCNHHWRQVFEESLIGGYFSIGWQCTKCDQYIPKDQLTPAGLSGTVSKGAELYPPHRGVGQCTDGSRYKKQIINENGDLTIIRPEDDS